MAKRTNGEGTIYQDKTGLWRGELTIGYDESGKRIKKQFTSMDLEVVQKKMNDEKFKLNRNIATQSSNFTVKEWLKFWLVTYKLNVVKPRTYDYYEEALILYVYDTIGNYRLDKIKTIQIQQLYNNLHKKGLATSTIKSAHVPLKQAFDQAINNELIYKNPCNGLTIPKKPKRISRAMSLEEQEIFTMACSGSAYHNFFLFLLNTGMRCGEGIALMWQDIDFEKNTINVQKTMSRLKNRAENAETKNIRVLGTTKTENSIRTIPINKKCAEIIKTQKEREDGLFVFASKAGTPLGHRNINRAYDELLSKIKLSDELTIHSLRHTFATRLLEKGANIKAVSELLGHSGIQITLDTYSHVLEKFKIETINLLD